MSDVLILGAGLSGLATAIDIITHSSLKVTMIDRDTEARVGGMARDAFGGITMIDTPYQRKLKIKDSPDLAWSDWNHFAEFDTEDHLPKKWAKVYVESSIENIYEWLTSRRVKFFPVVHWVERGLYKPGNSVPRFHMVWGTGRGLIEELYAHMNQLPNRANLTMHFDTKVTDLIMTNGHVTGARAVNQTSPNQTGKEIEFKADHTVIAAGGICGDVNRVKQTWYKPWGKAPNIILNGSHRYADGRLIDSAEALGARVTHLDQHWNYAAGVHHPRPQTQDKELAGLSLVPPRSALWLDAEGKRFEPMPLVTSFDTRFMVEHISRSQHQYSWQVLNRKIALRELAVSGSEFNPAIRDKKFVKFILSVLLGNKELVDDLCNHCPDFVVANSIDELTTKMNQLTGHGLVKPSQIHHEVKHWDDGLKRGKAFDNDEQLRRIAQVKQYKGDRLRTSKRQPINDPSAFPLIAIRMHILSRKTLGGLQTDLKSRVLDSFGNSIPGLYAVGEAAGFGGGGIHGKGSLEGTFLGSCILTARKAAETIIKG